MQVWQLQEAFVKITSLSEIYFRSRRFILFLTGLFPGKLAATVFNNKIELFEKANSLFKCRTHQNAPVGLGVFRILGYERPLEILK